MRFIAASIIDESSFLLRCPYTTKVEAELPPGRRGKSVETTIGGRHSHGTEGTVAAPWVAVRGR